MTSENVEQVVAPDEQQVLAIDDSVPFDTAESDLGVQTQDENLSDLGVSTVGGKEFKVLEPGNYDAIVHGIVFLGQVANNFKNKDGSPQAPQPTIKIIVEIPSEIRDNDGSTLTMGTDVTLSVGEKGNFTPIVSAILNKKMTKEDMAKYMFTAGLKELLGKAVIAGVVNVVKDDNKTRAYLDRKGFHPLDPRLPKPVAKRDIFFFNPYKPDIEVFEKTLTAWTRKQLMSAVNVAAFAPELKTSWAKMQVIDAQADEARKQPNKAAPTNGNTNSIE
jgi:hypothetical protein